jgi:hypothetical protein
LLALAAAITATAADVAELLGLGDGLVEGGNARHPRSLAHAQGRVLAEDLPRSPVSLKACGDEHPKQRGFAYGDGPKQQADIVQDAGLVLLLFIGTEGYRRVVWKMVPHNTYFG